MDQVVVDGDTVAHHAGRYQCAIGVVGLADLSVNAGTRAEAHPCLSDSLGRTGVAVVVGELLVEHGTGGEA